MPESVGIDVRKVVFDGEIPEPAGHGIRSGRTSILTAKYIARSNPILAVLQLPLTLFLLEFPEQIHGLLWELEGTPVTGFGVILMQAKQKLKSSTLRQRTLSLPAATPALTKTK